MQIIDNPPKSTWKELTARASTEDADIAVTVERIIEQVRQGGDEAIKELTQKIDNVSLETLLTSSEEISNASNSVSKELKAAIDTAKANIEVFHRAQVSPEVDIETSPGVRCVQRSVPIQRVGLYIPGGTAPLFSTVLMLAIPARIAGCPEIILCTPPDKSGSIAPEILYTASLCGVTRIFKVGGAQAIAAMAYGTETIPAVDKIFGPGNRYVTKAKQLVSLSQCAIDMPAGPSEVLILADESANPQFIAADMLSQAEHGADSQSILVTNSLDIAQKVTEAIDEQVKALPRMSIALQALKNSRIMVLVNTDNIIDFANEYAAEHLIVSMSNPWSTISGIVAAGSIFLGNYSPESAGDYSSGTNHTLPTSGWAKSTNGVNIDSFIRKITIQEISPKGLSGIASSITTMAEAEGLTAHAEAVRIRLKSIK